MLKLNNISFGYTKELIINNFSLEIKKGERVAIQGRSGSGKSTILRIIAGLEKPRKGTIYLDDEIINDTPTFKRNIGYVFQDFSLFPHMKIKENILYGMNNKKSDSNKEFFNRLIKMFKIEELLHKYPHQISGGEQQRVAIARSLATKPKLLLLDESFSALDTELKDSVRTDVLNALKEFNITTILVTHDVDDASVLCNRTIILK